MPWTFAHPAAVLPLRRWPQWLPLSGLVIGSMSPDFGYYSGHFDLAKVAHTPAGIFMICLPAALALAVLLRLLRGALVALLPQPHRGALASLPARPPLTNPREALALALAIVVGAATHMVWDAFTHFDGFAVEAWPALQQHLFGVGARQFHLYNTLQHASTAFGVLCLGIAYVRWLKRATPPAGFAGDGREGVRYGLLAACLLVAVAGALPLAIEVIGPQHGPYRSSMILVRTVIYSTSAFAALCVLAALLWPRLAAARRPTDAQAK